MVGCTEEGGPSHHGLLPVPALARSPPGLWGGCPMAQPLPVHPELFLQCQRAGVKPTAASDTRAAALGMEK